MSNWYDYVDTRFKKLYCELQGDGVQFMMIDGTEYCKWCRRAVMSYICWNPEEFRNVHEHMCQDCFSERHEDLFSDAVVEALSGD